MSIQKIFANEHWVVVAKPAEWLTTPARDRNDARPCLGLTVQAEMGRQIFPVHRLDFEVSGLVLMALTAECHRRASGWFEHGTVIKTYQALTVAGRGSPPLEWQEWRSKMLRGKRRSYVSPHGKECLTEARVVAESSGHWQWELRPRTGRPHQLRVELANHGTPILGDVLYGGPPGASAAIALNAVMLDFSAVDGERFGLPERLEWPQVLDPAIDPA